MDYELLKPWLIVLGYAVTVGLLLLGRKLAERADAGVDDRWRTAARLTFSAAGFVASATTLFWATLGTFSGPAMVLWAVFPVAVAAFVWWRSYRQREWMDRVAGKRGRLYTRHAPGRPSFGVLSAGGSAVAADDPRAGFESAVELDMRGQRVLGVQYVLGDVAPALPRKKKRPSKFLQAVDRVGNTYSAVQLRTPPVPTVVIAARSTEEQHKDFGPLEPGEIRPFEDARLTRNVFGALTPEAELRPVDLADDAFSQRFSVRADDAEFAAAVLSPEVRRHLIDDPWFSVREVVFHNGALWTPQFGELTEAVLVENSRQLTRLAATVPPGIWQQDQFVTALRAAGELGAPAAPPKWFNARRVAVGRVPLRPWSFALRAIVVLAMLIPGASLLTNSALAVTGLAPEVQLTVTAVRCDGTSDGNACGYDISGTYQLDGETHRLENANWLQWRMFGPLPEQGDVIEVVIAPLWWQPMIESTGVGVFLLVCGLGLLLAGLLAAKLLFNLAPKHETAERPSGSKLPEYAHGESHDD